MQEQNSFNERIIRHISPEVLNLIAQIDKLSGQWSGGKRLAPHVLSKLKKSVLVTSTGASTRIEGAKLSDADIEKMMRGINIQKFSDRDGQEVQGYYELLENIFESWSTLTFSEGLIKSFHKELLKYVEKDETHRGEYKKIENKVMMINDAGQSIGILFDTTNAMLTPSAMHDIVEWTKNALITKQYHPLLVIGSFLVEFLKIHPFTDGNGRISRILTNLLLLQAGYGYMPYVSHEKLVEDNKPEYYIALRRSQKTIGTAHEDISPWYSFFFTMVLKQSQIAISIMMGESFETSLSNKQIQVLHALESADEISPQEIMKSTRLPRATVAQVLDKFLRLEKIERLGNGRSTRYRLVR